MRARDAVAVCAGLLIAGCLAVRAAQPQAGMYLAEIDAVVTDDAGKPVVGLKQGEFQIKDDGKRVEVKTFEEVAETGDRVVPRSIVLLLDDSGLGPGNTATIQQIARIFIAHMAPADEFSVIRMNNRRDEAFGDRLEALLRIDEYRSDARPFFGRETLENALNVFAKVSRTLEPIEHRRKALVCIGVPEICTINEPSGRTSLIWRFWVDTLGAMSRSNASLYSFEPIGVPRNNRLTAGTIAEASGGDVFLNASDVIRPIDIIRRDTGNYYLLGYWSSPSDKPLHTVEVKVNRRGVHIRARRLRGDST